MATSDSHDTSPNERFTQLWCTAEPDLRAWVRYRCPQDWEDILQEARVTAWQRFGTYRPDGPFLAWCRGHVRFHLFRHFRRRKRQRLEFQEPEVLVRLVDEFAASEPTEPEWIDWLRDCLKGLQEGDQEMLRERAAGHEMAGLAEKLGITLAAAYQRSLRALARVRSCVQGRRTG